MAQRDYLLRVDGEFRRNSLGRLIKYTHEGAHTWAHRHQPNSYSVIRLVRPDLTPTPMA